MDNTAYRVIWSAALDSTDHPISDQGGLIYEKSVPSRGNTDSTNDTSITDKENGMAQSTANHRVQSNIIPALVPQTVPFLINCHQIQLWEGRVDSVGSDSFTATISDRTNPSLPDESVEIGLDELGDSDRARVKPGALFIWSIHYEDAGSGRNTVSRIRFRRFRKWTKQSLKSVKKNRELIDRVIDGE